MDVEVWKQADPAPPQAPLPHAGLTFPEPSAPSELPSAVMVADAKVVPPGSWMPT